MSVPESPDVFTIERRGGVTIFAASPELEKIDFALFDEAGDILLEPLRKDPSPLVLIDLSQVDYFGSMFVAILLKCFKFVESRDGMMALCGVSPRAGELLRITALATVWPIYATRREALEAMLSE